VKFSTHDHSLVRLSQQRKDTGEQVVKEFLQEAASQRGFVIGKVNVTLDFFCGRPIGTLVDSTRENPDVIPQKCPFPRGCRHPSDTQLLGLIPVDVPNGISIGSAVSHDRHRQTDRPTDHVTLRL